MRNRWIKTLLMALCLMLVAGLLSPFGGRAQAASTATILREGDQGGEVIRLQSELATLGYYSGALSGYFGTKTKAAVTLFQRAQGLEADGEAGPLTRAAMNNLLESVSRGLRPSTGELYWLARLIEAEAEGESMTGKIAVGNVVVNRVWSAVFPNSIYDVIFEVSSGAYQFSPVLDGRIYNEPSQESQEAARAACAQTSRPAGASLYFFNPAKVTATWIVTNRSWYCTIGNHSFYY